MNNETVSKFGPTVLCGVLSVFVDFVLIPRVFSLPPMLGLPDPIWMSLMILIPVIIGIYMLGQKAYILPGYVWVGLPVQYLILIVFAEPISRIGSWGDWTYIWDAMIWPLSVTAAQFISLIALRTWKKMRNDM